MQMEKAGQAEGRLPVRTILWAVIAAILVAPLVAMQFTGAVQWTAFDFAVAALLLIGAMGLYEIASRLLSNSRHRALAGAGLGLAVLLLWAEGAVGIFH